MNQLIKKRIEAVRRGEVPEGYLSENHQLRPADWQYDKIGKYLVPYDEFSNETEAYPLATSSRQGLMLQSEYYSDQRYEETSGGFHVVPEGYVTYRHMSDDDIFRFNVNKMGTPVLVSPEYPVFTTAAGLDQDLLIAYLNNMKEFTAYCSAQKKGSTRTRMYFSRLSEFVMPIPPIEEQQKIAEILAICDRMIELKQQLLEEKHKAFRHIMTMLFKGANGYRELGKMAKITMGQSPDSSSYNTDEDGVPLLQGNADISNGFPAPRYYTNQPTKMCMPGDLLLSVRAPVGEVSHSDRSACIGRGLCSIRAGKFTEFIYYYLRYYEPEWNKISQGSTFTAISGDDIKKVQIPAVDDITLNRSINILRCADNEIQLLKQDLEAWQQKKKALIQLLLTGLVRVNA